MRHLVVLLLWLAAGTVANAQEILRVAGEIDWKAAQRDLLEDRSKEPQPLRGPDIVEADQVLLPVLAIDTDTTRAAPSFAQQRTSYAAFYELSESATLSVMGSVGAIALEGNDPLARELDESIEFTETEDGAEISLTRYGASYTIRATCKDPEDRQCSERFLTQAAGALVVAGGAELD